jgi:hypothetical protein
MTVAVRTSRFLHPAYEALAEADRCPACPECPGLLLTQDAWEYTIAHWCGLCRGDGVASHARERLGAPRFGARCHLPARPRLPLITAQPGRRSLLDRLLRR